KGRSYRGEARQASGLPGIGRRYACRPLEAALYDVATAHHRRHIPSFHLAFEEGVRDLNWLRPVWKCESNDKIVGDQDHDRRDPAPAEPDATDRAAPAGLHPAPP